MTITVRIRGERQTLTADNALDLVRKLARSSLEPQYDQREWMKRAAERAHSMTDHLVRSDTASHFIEDLLNSGLITDVNED